MSMLLMVKAMQIKVGNPLRKLVLIKLADNANDKGECWPSYKHIADQCEVGHSTVRKHIKDLQKQGLLSIENRKGPKGNSSNLYYLHLDAPMPLGSIPMPPDSTAPMPPDSTRTSHSLESVNEPKAIVELKPDVAEKVIQYLNDKSGRQYKAVPSNKKFIEARIKEGATPKDLVAVINRKCAEWLDNPEMAQYLRPSTLFGATNFNNYVGQLNTPLPAKRVDSSNPAGIDFNSTGWMR